MKEQRTFWYSSRFKIIGILFILWGIYSFFVKYREHHLWDINLVSGLLCWGLSFILFSSEKTDDERTHHHKFKALTWAVPAGLIITHLINYFFLSPAEPDSGKYTPSVSAYVALSIVLIIALGLFYYLQYQDRIDEKSA